MTSRYAIAGLLLALAGSANAATIYESDFGSGLSGFTTTGAIRTDNGVSYLGNLTQGATGALTLDLSGYTNVTVSFDLYAVLSLDGDGPSGGSADPFLVTQDAGTLFNYTFANFSGASSQSYPAAGSAPKSGSFATNLLGFGSGDFGDTEYHIAPIALAGGGSTVLTFTGNSNQGIGDEFYGINNIVVTGDKIEGAVPEPATWAMMVGGIGTAGAAMRRGRRDRTRAALA